ncbi:hypothetical protein [Kineosporia mesophila]|uniref:hypothetical protein n=1 Tax=Kineosporia mesophila TaxID=566012 RepID=UPI001E419D8B|nr:hypothetical protein [Kineosporia mesophila]MCD5354745.1 hypothetical protein [Kineosporia mesophila]
MTTESSSGHAVVLRAGEHLSGRIVSIALSAVRLSPSEHARVAAGGRHQVGIQGRELLPRLARALSGRTGRGKRQLWSGVRNRRCWL